MMKRKIIAVLLICILAASVLSGCGVKSSKDSVTALFGPEPSTIDPGLMQTVDAATYAVHLFEGLVRDNHGKFEPGVAKSWDVSKDFKTYTFHLRDNARWSDGQPVKAQDFEYAWKRNLNPETASPYAYIMYYIQGGAEYNSHTQKEDATDEEKKAYETEHKKLEDNVKVKAADDKTLEVTLVAPVSFFLELTANQPTFMPLRKDTIEANKETWTQSPSTYLTNGAYKLKEWKHNDEILVEKNDNYWDKNRIVLKNIHFKLMDDVNAALSATEAGEIDVNYAHVPMAEIPRLEKEGKAKIYPDLAIYFYEFNTTKAPFDNPKVRKAVALAIDRQYIVDKVTMAYQKPAVGFVPYGFPDPIAKKDFREADPAKYLPETANVAEAKKLLAEAGYPDGKGFPEIEFIYNTNDSIKKIAEAVQEQLKTNLGISMKLANMEWAVYFEALSKQEFDLSSSGFGADYSDPMSFIDLYISEIGNSFSGWSNAEYDKLVETAKNTDDQKVRFESMHKAEKLLMDEMPILPLYFYTKTIMEPEKLKNTYKAPTGLYFFHDAYLE